MIKLDEIESYYNFPYQPRQGEMLSDTNSPCIGGIDLTQTPERIDEIPEIKHSPMLKRMLVELNKPESPYITLGCAYWLFNDNREPSYAYLEITFKEISTAQDLDFIQNIDEKFIDYLHHHRQSLALEFGVPVEALDTVHLAFSWRYRPYRHFESAERNLLYIQLSSPQHQDMEILLELLHRFLTQYLVVPS